MPNGRLPIAKPYTLERPQPAANSTTKPRCRRSSAYAPAVSETAKAPNAAILLAVGDRGRRHRLAEHPVERDDAVSARARGHHEHPVFVLDRPRRPTAAVVLHGDECAKLALDGGVIVEEQSEPVVGCL